MRVQDAVLQKLEEKQGEFLSGEALAMSLGVSRNAVWKGVKGLRADGYDIEAVPGQGYALGADADVLTAESVARRLDVPFPVRVEVRREVTSTNDVLKAEAERGAPEGTVLIAETQTGGKGRLGRRFESPVGTGLYLSILLRPRLSAEGSLFITTAAAVAVAEAVEEVADVEAQIKWVNDVYVGGKKVCGILTEASVDFESGGLHWAVLGIGINITEPEGGFPPALREIAAAVFPGKRPAPVRSRLAAAVIRRFFAYYADLGSASFLAEYRRRSFLDGRRVSFALGNERFSGVAAGIDEKARLVVRLDSGETRAFSAGEVSLHRADATEESGGLA